MVAPRYGTMDDLRRLIKKLHDSGMKLVLDLVPGHTSYQHKWFQQSSETTANEFSNRYVWTRDVWEVETEPEHNYIKGFMGRDGNFMTNFFYCQPALNYGFYETKYPWEQKIGTPDTTATRNAMLDVIKFYFDIGADGLRVDMAFSLIKRDPEKKGITALWQEIRSVLDKDYPEKFIISEWSQPTEALEAGFHIDMLLHFNNYIGSKLIRYETWAEQGDHGPDKHSFFRSEGKGDFCEFLDPFLEIRKKTISKGFTAIPIGNHDVPRVSFGRTQRELKVLYTFFFTFTNVPLFYYGDEIGLEYIADIPSIEGGYNRTGCRNCMHWNAGKNGGFSEADKLLMPIGDAGENNVEKQEKDSDSLLNYLKKLISIRKSTPALAADTDIEFILAEKGKYPVIFRRKEKNASYIVIINPKDEAFTHKFDKPVTEVLSYGIALKNNTAALEPVSCGIYKE
jgi:maltose alpha-D-glucosyltransferase/alpha-amylase